MIKSYIYLILISLVFVSCGTSGSDDTNTFSGIVETPESTTNTPTADNFALSINLNDGVSTSNWKTYSNASDLDANSILSASVKTAGSLGTSSIDGDNLLYTPTNSGSDIIVLTISDETNKTVDVSVTINISEDTSATPTASNFTIEVDVDTVSTNNWKTDSNANDTDANSILSASIKTQGTHGTSSIDGDNLIYTPSSDGSDVVVLTISDETNKTVDINVNITISASYTPTASNYDVVADINTVNTSDWKINSNASDLDANSILSASIKTQGSKGTSIIEEDNLIYTPSDIGNDIVVLTISDQTNKTVDINVNITTEDLNGLKISYATYNNNATSDTEEDVLSLYFNKKYANGSVYKNLSENFDINGVMEIGESSIYYEDFRAFSIMNIVINNDTTLSVEPDNSTTIALEKNFMTDFNGNFPKVFESIKIDSTNLLANLSTSNNWCFRNDENLTEEQTEIREDFNIIVDCSDENAIKSDGYYNLTKVTRDFTINGETVIDNKTSLVWQKEDDAIKRTHTEAISYCDDLYLCCCEDIAILTPIFSLLNNKRLCII